MGFVSQAIPAGWGADTIQPFSRRSAESSPRRSHRRGTPAQVSVEVQRHAGRERHHPAPSAATAGRTRPATGLAVWWYLLAVKPPASVKSPTPNLSSIPREVISESTGGSRRSRSNRRAIRARTMQGSAWRGFPACRLRRIRRRLPDHARTAFPETTASTCGGRTTARAPLSAALVSVLTQHPQVDRRRNSHRLG